MEIVETEMALRYHIPFSFHRFETCHIRPYIIGQGFFGDVFLDFCSIDDDEEMENAFL